MLTHIQVKWDGLIRREIWIEKWQLLGVGHYSHES